VLDFDLTQQCHQAGELSMGSHRFGRAPPHLFGSMVTRSSSFIRPILSHADEKNNRGNFELISTNPTSDT
jgi:hypothetical protein